VFALLLFSGLPTADAQGIATSLDQGHSRLSLVSSSPPERVVENTVFREAVRRAVRVPNAVREGRQAPDDPAWSLVRQLAAGDEVRALLDTGTSSQGTFRTADDESMTLVSGNEQRLSRAHVRHVSVARGTHRRRHVLVGLAIGAAVSVLAVNLSCRGESRGCNEVAPAYFYPLAGAGATIGALLPAGKKWHVVYIRTEP